MLFALATIALSSNVFAGGKFDPKGSGCSFKEFIGRFSKQEKSAPTYNTFLVAETVAHPNNEFWVFWVQQREIMLVGWPAQDCDKPSLLIRKRLKLTKDFVKTQEGVGSSTYLETEEWARQVLLAAAKAGYQVNVKK